MVVYERDIIVKYCLNEIHCRIQETIAIRSVPVVICLESLQVLMIKAVHPFPLFIYSYTACIVLEFLCSGFGEFAVTKIFSSLLVDV